MYRNIWDFIVYAALIAFAIAGTWWIIEYLPNYLH